MANASPIVTPASSYVDFLTAFSDYLQHKHDPRGSEVDPADTNTRAGAELFNAYDDALKALWQRGTRTDTRVTGAVVTGSAASGGGTVDFEVSLDAGLTLYTVHWLRVVSDASSVGGRVQLYADSGRTKLVYDRDIVDTSDPPVAAAETYDANPWCAVSSDGTDLADSKLYGTITNDGGTNSTYTVSLIAQAL